MNSIYRNALALLERSLTALSLSALLSASAGCAGATSVRLRQTSDAPLIIGRPSLYPETVEVNPLNGRFLVSSIREGAVYEVGLDGALKQLVQDDRLTSILGIAVDPRSNRLLVTNSDLGAGIRHSARGARKEAGVGIYDLSTGRALRYVDLVPLIPEGDHLMNGITVDSNGNAYVTDSFTPAIYKIDPDGLASVFLKDDEFKGKGVNLNGVVSNRKGFLLVVMKSNGFLYRVPLADPRRFTRVSTAATFLGGDGLLLIGDDKLVLVANQIPGGVSNSAFVLQTNDDWATAAVVDSKSLGDIYPTSCVALGGKLYALSSHLNEWIGASEVTRGSIAQVARLGELQEIGLVAGSPSAP